MTTLIYFLIFGFMAYRIIKGSGIFNGYNGKKGIGGPPTVSVNPVKERRENIQQTSNTPPTPTMQQQTVEENYTMAYLNEKARLDDMEHAREKREEAIRLNKNHGGIRVAERLYEGSSVPEGKRCCTCGYCGAENLIPMMPRERYSCYFCREPL